MSLFDFFNKNKRNSGKVARDRLMMVLQTERSSTKIPNLDAMKTDLINVVKKYIKIQDVNVKTNSNQEIETLEIEIILDK